MLLGSSAVLPIPQAEADSATTLATTLPEPRDGPETVLFQGLHYIIGGRSYTSQPTSILRFDPATETVSDTGLDLPSERRDAALVNLGLGYGIRVLGGLGPSGFLDETLRVNPATGVVEVLEDRLPSPRAEAGFALNYMFGGRGPNGLFDEILLVHAYETVVMNARLPTPRAGVAAVLAGSHIYLFGGTDSSGHLDEILQYDVVNDQITTLSLRLPSPTVNAAAVDWGAVAFLFGGTGSSREVRAFDAEVGTITTMAQRLPAVGMNSAALVDAATNRFYVLGGCCTVDSVVRYTLEPDAPSSLTASPGPGAGQIRLSWTPPPTNSYHGPLIENHIYRGTTASELTFLQTVSPTSSTFIDSGLPNGAQRFYAVVAVGHFGESPQSNIADSRTPVLPSAPQGLDVAQGPGSGVLTLTWAAPADTGGIALSGYKVYRGTTPGELTLRQTLGNVTTFADTGNTPGITYYYEVTATNAVGEGPRSNQDSGVVPGLPGPPRDLVGFNPSGVPGFIRLEWKPPLSDGYSPITNYVLHRGTSANPPEYLELGTVTSYNDTCTSGTLYFYHVRAKNAIGTGAASNEFSIGCA